MTLKIEYRLVGTGWAKCNISSSDSSCGITASYLGNALQDLVLAACAVSAGFKKVTFSFDEEPGEYRWVIHSPRMNEIEIEILSFDQLWGDASDAEGKRIFKTTVRPGVFAKAVHKAAKSIFDEFGEIAYLKKWSQHPFPTELFLELSRMVENYPHGK
jgi:hypothetical protein